jgi:hypothetical protein
MLQDYERLFAQDSDEARAQLVLFRLARASFLNATTASDAEEAARRITNPVLASWARGYCEKFKADVMLKDYREKLRAYRRDPTTSKALTLADDPKLKEIQLAFAAAVASFSQAGDLKTAENLRKLVEAPLADVESGKWHAPLTNLEAESLRLNIEETERSVRGPLFELLEARLYLHAQTWKLKDNKPLDAEFRQALEQTRNCLKPMRFVEVRFADPKLDDFLRNFLRACEARL